MRLQILFFALLFIRPLLADEPSGLSPTAEDDAGPEGGSPPALSSTAMGAPPPPLNLLSVGSLDDGLAISAERFLDPRASVQLEADDSSQAYLGTFGLGAAFRFYPIGHGTPTFYGGARLRAFEQDVWGNGAPGFYRGLRGGPQIGVRLPAYKDLVISYELAWSWDLSLYKSDPSMQIGDSWMADVQYAGTSGRISDALSLGWVF